MKLILITVLCFINCRYASSLSSWNESSIIGGYSITITEVPYIAYIVAYHNTTLSNCGGTILSVKFVMTAAHCFEHAPDKIIISVGNVIRQKGTRYTSARHIVHPDHQKGHTDFDIAVVETKTKIIFNYRTVQAARLVGADTNPAAGSFLAVLGWGRTAEFVKGASRTLQSIDVRVVKQDECAKVYKGSAVVSERSFCAGDMDGNMGICNGDSGGPAVDFINTVIGIVSGSIGCARKGVPGIYTKVSVFRGWIKSVAYV